MMLLTLLCANYLPIGIRMTFFRNVLRLAGAALPLLLILCALAPAASAAPTIRFTDQPTTSTAGTAKVTGLTPQTMYTVHVTLRSGAMSPMASCAGPTSTGTSCTVQIPLDAIRIEIAEWPGAGYVSTLDLPTATGRVDRRGDIVTGRGTPNTRFDVTVTPKSGAPVRSIEVTTDATGLLRADFSSGPSQFDIHAWDEVRIVHTDASGDGYEVLLKQLQIELATISAVDLWNAPGDYASIQLFTTAGVPRTAVLPIPAPLSGLSSVNLFTPTQPGDVLRVVDTGGVTVDQLTVPGRLSGQAMSPDATSIAGTYTLAPS